MSNTKTPAQQVQEALTLVGRLFVQAQDAACNDSDRIAEMQKINAALAADLAGTVKELEMYRQTDTGLREDIAFLRSELAKQQPAQPNRFNVGDKVFVRTHIGKTGYSKVWCVKLHIGHETTSVLYSTDYGDAVPSAQVFASAAEAFGEV